MASLVQFAGLIRDQSLPLVWLGVLAGHLNAAADRSPHAVRFAELDSACSRKSLRRALTAAQTPGAMRSD